MTHDATAIAAAGMALADSVEVEASGLPIGFRIFLAVLALGGLAIAAGSPLSRRLHRNRAVAALAAGGWFAVLAGVGLGPAGLDVVDDAIFAEVRPLLVVALGWVGLIVGLQARWRILQAVPTAVWRWCGQDLLLSSVIAVSLAMLAASLWVGSWDAPGAALGGLAAIASLAAANLGWAPETRSLRIELTDRTRRLAVLVSAGAGLASMTAILLAGLPVLPLDDLGRSLTLDPTLAFIRLGVLTGTALLAAVGARFLLAPIERGSPQMLVILLGLVCLVGGIADAAGVPPLLSGLFAGIAIANLPEGPSRDLESVLHRGETAGAMLLYAVAGLLLVVDPGWPSVALAVALALFRIFLKPTVMLAALRRGDEEVPSATPLRLACVRQAPTAVAIAVSLVLAEDSQLSRLALTVVVLAGLASGLLAPLRSLQRRVLATIFAREVGA